MTPTIRRLGPADLGDMRGLLSLFARVFEEQENCPDRQPDDGWLLDLLGQPGFVAMVAIEVESVVGALTAYELVKYEQPRREFYIYDLAVDAACRRRGIATALIARVREIAAERGAWTVFVQADRGDDPAISLYSGLGRREDVLHFDFDPG